MLKIVRTPEGKKFLVAVAIIFLIAITVMSKVTFQGVEDQYNLPMSQWNVSLYFIQGAWATIYSIMFTIIGSLPFGFYFLGPKDDRG